MIKKLINAISILTLITLVTYNPQTAFAQPGSTCATNNDCNRDYPYCLRLGENGAKTCVSAEQIAQRGVQQKSEASTAIETFTYKAPKSLLPTTNAGIQFFLVGSGGFGGTAEDFGGQKGAIGETIALTSFLYKEQPASTIQYLAYVSDKIGFPVKDANAQTIGSFRNLSPILGIWSITRDIALVGFVVVIAVVGFLIMIRKQIDPRTVVTIQQALPKLIISLILLLFSYGICSLFIDAMNVVTYAGATALQRSNLIAFGPEAQRPILLGNLLKANIFQLWDQFYDISRLFQDLSNISGQQNAGLNSVSRGLDIVANAFGMQNLIAGGSILRTVLFIAMFVALIRTFFMLLTSYIMVTIKIILSPFSFLMMAIPGSGRTFGAWAKSIIAHLAVFPVVFFMLALAAIFTSQASNPQDIFSFRREQYNHWTDLFQQPKTNIWRTGSDVITADQAYWAPPALGNWFTVTGPLIGLGILLTIPKTSTLIREAIQYKGSQAEGAAGESLLSAARRINMLRPLTHA